MTSQLKDFTLTMCMTLLLSSCAMSSVSSFKLAESKYPYRRVLVSPLDNSSNFRKLDSSSFEHHIKHVLTPFDNYKVREHLQKSMVRNLQSPQTLVMKSNDHFQVHKEVGYDQFIQTTDSLMVQAILFVDMEKYWNTMSVVDGNSYQQANALFNCLLLDLKTREVMWIGDVQINGLAISGYDVLNNHLSRLVAQKLVREKLIYPVPSM